jgi:hypothetical protein
MPLGGKGFAVGLGLGWALVVLLHFNGTGGTPVDAWCYYAIDASRPYDLNGCFMYSPPIAQLMLGIQAVMPFETFVALLRTIEVGLLAILAGPAIGPLLLVPAVAIEVNAANINVLLVAAVLVGFRRPWAWSFVILTKVTPGIGLLWFAARREWSNLAIAVGATALLAAASWLLNPGMWPQYFAGLTAEPDASPFVLWWRLPLAALLVIWGARTDRRWTMVVALMLAMPRWYYLTPVVLVGLFPLVRLPRPLPLGSVTLRRIPARWAMIAPRTAWRTARAAYTAVATSEGRTERAPSS